MKRSTGIAMMFALWMGATMPVEASESGPQAARPPIPDVDKVIFDCNEAERNNYRGSTTQMRAAALSAAMCIRNAIVENMVILAGEEYRQKTVDQLEHINKGIGGFYWALYNEIEPCFHNQPGCGTMYETFHNAKVEAIYGEILRETIRQRREYRW